MKIAHVITRLIVGGAQENTVATCIGLLRRGHAVDLIIGPQAGPEGSLAEQARAAGVPLIVVDELRRAPYPLLDLQAALVLARLFREQRYTVVHTHSGKAGFLGRLAARLARVPIVVHTIHGPSFYRYQNPIGNWVFTWAEQVAATWTTQFISVANAMTAQYLAAGVGRPEQYRTIHSGMDVAAFLAARREPGLRRQLGIRDGDVVIGKVARLFRLKGHEYLFAAAPRIVQAVPQAKFLLVGDGTYRARFERWADRLGLRERFVFTGLVPPQDVPRYLAQMDLLVHLSLREGLPRTLPQALAAGKPVIAFDVDGAPEICRTGATGTLVRAEDVNGLVEAVIRLLRDPVLAHRMGAHGKQIVAEQFGEELMVQQIEHLYQTLATTVGRV